LLGIESQVFVVFTWNRILSSTIEYHLTLSVYIEFVSIQKNGNEKTLFSLSNYHLTSRLHLVYTRPIARSSKSF
jgi:hypothetical protein